MKLNHQFLVLTLAVVLPIGLFTGCNDGSSLAQSKANDEGFAAGAFPPTLSSKEYHSLSWTRTDCMTCHETGVLEAPKVKHVSLPKLAVEAKCRTCHVTVADSNESP